MSKDYKTPILKLLVKTRNYLRSIAKSPNVQIRKNIKGEHFTSNFSVTKNGNITVKILGDAFSGFEVEASITGDNELTFAAKGHRSASQVASGLSPKFTLGEQEAHYLLRTYIKKALGQGWQSFRAPVRNTKVVTGRGYRIEAVTKVTGSR